MEKESEIALAKRFQHVLPGEHVYDGMLFFGYTPADTLEAVKHFKVRDDDVFLATYPKAGTTWLQEVAWLVAHDGDFETAGDKPVYFRSPFLEFKDDVLNEVGLNLAEEITPPRVIKSHLPFRLMPHQLATSNCKTLVLFRNPKDLCVSYYHFYRSSSSFGNFKGTWPEFLDMFLEGHVDHGSWFDYTRSWWERRDDPNTKIIFYEDMKRDLRAEVVKICDFLGKSSISEADINRIVTHCSFESMKQNPMTNHLDVYSINAKVSPLLRSGTVGDWKRHFTVAESERFDKFYNDVLGEFDIPFQYQLPKPGDP